MSGGILRFLQVKASLEQGKDLPGIMLIDYFTEMEVVSPISCTGTHPEFLISVKYKDEIDLSSFSIEGIFEVIKIISKEKHSALLIAQFPGPIFSLMQQIEECWLQTPSKLSIKNGLFLTVHGTTNGLKKFRDGIKQFLPDSIKVRITKDLKADWIAAPQLPQRRKEVIDLAVKKGYYKTPRKCTQRELAADLGVRQGTVAEHLQSAEGLIIESWSEQSRN